MKETSNRKIYQKFKVDKRIIALGLIAWLVSFFIDIWPIVFLTLFSVANVALLSFKRYFDAPVDIEFSNFSAILMTYQYGVTYGILAAVLTKFASMMYNKKIKANYLFMMSSYVVAAVLAGYFKGLPVVTLGVIVTILSNVYLGMIRKFVVQYSSFEVFSYGVSNFIFNFVLFIGFSELLLFLMP